MWIVLVALTATGKPISCRRTPKSQTSVIVVFSHQGRFDPPMVLSQSSCSTYVLRVLRRLMDHSFEGDKMIFIGVGVR
jgi:1-acyl-sn-glycerol-3-phosphate acyltransferase